MKYRKYIEDFFVIDEPKSGQLVPFIFNKAQDRYYKELCAEYDIEKNGLTKAIREFIVKARREGFSSFILALFAADDLLQENPTETMVISYKDDATAIFRKRYRRYILSCAARKSGETIEGIQNDPNILEKYSKVCFSVDAADLELRHNHAHFYCGTASARTGSRGGVLQKLLFSEAAHYPDLEKITAKEIIEGTAQQVDKASGWIFQESTANGIGNYFHATYEAIIQGLSRYILRFYGWRAFYTEEQFKVIASEFTDPDMLKQEYPENVEEAFLSSNLSFTNRDKILGLTGIRADKSLLGALEISGENYIDQCEMIRDFLATLERTNKNHRLYVGVDSAKDIDRSIVYVLRETELSANGGVRCIAIDATGQGDFIPDWLEKNTRWHIHRVKFSRPSKSVMYKNLMVIIEDKLTLIPDILKGKEFLSEEWKHFYKQMLTLQKEIIGDLIVVQHPKGQCNRSTHDYDNCPYHDDHPDAWALAELGYVVINGVPDGQRPPGESSNFDNSVRRLLGNDKRRGKGRDNYD